MNNQPKTLAQEIEEIINNAEWTRTYYQGGREFTQTSGLSDEEQVNELMELFTSHLTTIRERIEGMRVISNSIEGVGEEYNEALDQVLSILNEEIDSLTNQSV
jgi:hypothetical protein